MSDQQQQCECVVCCDGEHAGYCRDCAGWGERGGIECEKCHGDGVCTVCNGLYLPSEGETGGVS